MLSNARLTARFAQAEEEKSAAAKQQAYAYETR